MALGKPGVTAYKRITIRRSGEEIRTCTYILAFNKTKILKKVKIGYCIERVEQNILHSRGVLNVKDMATTGRTAEDVRNVKDDAKKT